MTGKGSQAREILRRTGALDRPLRLLVAAYLLLTPLSAAADALSWFLLVMLITGPTAQSQLASGSLGLMGRLVESWSLDARGLLSAVGACFLARAMLAVAAGCIDGAAQARLRRNLQERLFSRLLGSPWAQLRSGQVGIWVGALTEEVTAFSKYVLSLVRAAYFGVTALVLIAMAFAIDARLTLAMCAAGGPAWLLLKWLYRHQSALSADMTRHRQGFAADITERLSGLFQIKAAGEEETHARLGARRQEDYTGTELDLALYTGVISAFNLLMLPLMLGVFAWLVGGPDALRAQIAALGGVGLLGYRAMSQLSQFVASVGTLTRLAGCVEPLHRIASLEADPERSPLPAPLRTVRLKDVAVRADQRLILGRFSARARSGRLLLLVGPSGTGKTTVANLAAGLLSPDEGQVLYEDATGASHDARTRRARIGYVAQDVHLLRGTVRQNLDPAGGRGDEELFDALRRAGAERFVRERGGLDAEVAEAGRSFSGGEKRRLAIAHALASRADALILDEVTNGLDDASKAGLVETISALAAERVVIAITHDLAAFAGVEAERVDLGATR
jgi:ABC-type multidrug transport system fused ATPase/permease subunit